MIIILRLGVNQNMLIQQSAVWISFILILIIFVRKMKKAMMHELK